MGPFVRRLVALTVIWLLATAALTYAAARRISTPPVTTTTTASTTTPSAPETLVVPDVRKQAYVFAEGTLGDAGFAWKVEGSVQGYAANTVVEQAPAPGTRVVDTGAPLIVLHLSRPAGGKELGVPEDSSPTQGTALKLADLALADTPPLQTATVATTPAAAPAPKATPAPKKTVAVTAPKKKTPPAHRWPQNRPPAFIVPGARKEPLDEMPLSDRAQMLLRWVDAKPKPTNANVSYWLYQHAWIVAGARLGWWHGSDALHTLLTVDSRVWSLWGIGARSEQLARQALAEVEARSS